MANKREGSAAGSPKKRAKPTKGQREFLERMMRDGVDNYDAEGNPIPMRKKRGKTTAQPKQGGQQKDENDSDDNSGDSDDSTTGIAAEQAAQQKANKKKDEKAAHEKAKKDAEEKAKPHSTNLLPNKFRIRLLADGGAKGSPWPIFAVGPPKPVAPTTNPDITLIPVGQMSDAYPYLKRTGERVFLRVNLGDSSTLWVNERGQMASNIHMLIRDPFRDPKKRTAIVADRIEQHKQWLGRARAHHRYRTLVWELKHTTWEVSALKTLVHHNKAHNNNPDVREDLMARPTWEILKDVMMSRVIAGLSRGGTTSRQVPEGYIPGWKYDIDGNKMADPQLRRLEGIPINKEDPISKKEAQLMLDWHDETPKTAKQDTPKAGPGPDRRHSANYHATTTTTTKTTTTESDKSTIDPRTATPGPSQPFPTTSMEATVSHRPLTIGETRAQPGISQAEKDLASVVNGTGMSLPTVHISKVYMAQPKPYQIEQDYGLKMNEAAKIFSEKAKKHTAELKAKASGNHRARSV
ncbi:MAG: hypothetical protein M1823_006155 [Watsoniomyces obsoletus]|nr:MAG: hypothetical protein M1823_006155 [Watsoniomyces obsoletus]